MRRTGHSFADRGATGWSTRQQFPLEWDAETNIRWKIRNPGEGWSAPVVWGNRLFLTAAVLQRPPQGSTAQAARAPALSWRRRSATIGPDQGNLHLGSFLRRHERRESHLATRGPRGVSPHAAAQLEYVRDRDARHRRRTGVRLLWHDRFVLLRFSRRSPVGKGPRQL